MSESFQNVNRAIRRPNSNHYINPDHSHNQNNFENHTCMTSRCLDHNNLELITAVADSTFLKTMELVFFCFLSVAWSWSLQLVKTATQLSSDRIFDWSMGTSMQYRSNHKSHCSQDDCLGFVSVGEGLITLLRVSLGSLILG